MKAAILTLGCRLNQADTALMTGRLQASGYTFTEEPDDSTDVIILNSCAVTASASRKSRQTLRSLRTRFPKALIAVTGCAVNAAPDDFTGADAVLSNEDKKSLIQFLEAAKSKIEFQSPAPEINVFHENAPSEFPFRSRANLKIQEGCNNFCTYCIVPYTRGRERSRDAAETIEDFKRLSDAGYREITLTGINTCTYQCNGLDLPALLEKLLELPGDFRIRIGSTEPGDILFRVIDIMASANGRVCEFLHPSLQNGSDTILKLMNRHYFTEDYRKFTDYAREKVPHIHIGTDVITGFPGETEALFEESFHFIESIHFANIHVFPYSPRKGTKAAGMSNRPSSADAERRAAKLRELRDLSAAQYHKSLIGSIQTFIPEENLSAGAEGWTGSYVRIRIPEKTLQTGELYRVKITGISTDGFPTAEIMS